MKRDIENRADLELLLTEFYKIAVLDDEIGHHFADLDLASHLPVIVDFWEKILLGNAVYFGNPMQVHQKLHEKFPLKPEHFQRWIDIFNRTLDRHFAGEQTENARLRAKMIAHSLNQRINQDSVRIVSKSAN